MKNWKIINQYQEDDIIENLLKNRGIKTTKQIENFLHPSNPDSLTTVDVKINRIQLKKALQRIQQAIKKKESIVVYTDYDADGICGGAILWETLNCLGAKVMPYVPHREEEGYGFSIKGIDAVKEKFNPQLIISVDHGITAWDKVAYATKQGIDVIVTDHHSLPKKLPDCLLVHTTQLSGAGVAWFSAKELLKNTKYPSTELRAGEILNTKYEYLALAAIGTIADLVPLVGANRSIVSHGLKALNNTKRVGLRELINDAGLTKNNIGTYEVSHMLAPRLNALGRLEHALDALRLLCTNNLHKARQLAKKLGLVNRERQQLMDETTRHAKKNLEFKIQNSELKKILFIAHEKYSQGVIGLVAGKLVEEYYRPAVVVQKGEKVSKASARSISGFNIIEAIRTCSDILVDAGGHPMAAGFTIETHKLVEIQQRLEQLAEKQLDEEILIRKLIIDIELPLSAITFELWEKLQQLEPFGMGNPRPVFATKGAQVIDARVVGHEGKHLKLQVIQSTNKIGAIGFGMGEVFKQLKPNQLIDIAYTVELDEWNGERRLVLKLKDIKLRQ